MNNRQIFLSILIPVEKKFICEASRFKVQSTISILRMCEVLVEDIGKVDGLRAEGELGSGVIGCRVVLGRQPLVVPVLSRTIHNR